MRITQIKWTAAVVLAVSLVGVGVGAVWFPRGEPSNGFPQAPPPPNPMDKPQPNDQADEALPPRAIGRLGETGMRVKDLIYGLAFSKDGTLASCDGKTIHLWDVATGKELRQFQGSAYFVSALAFTPDGKTLASAGFGPQVRLWDPATGKELRQFDTHPDRVSRLVFSPDGKTLATAGGERSRGKPGGKINRPEDDVVRVWDPATGKELAAFKDGIKGALGAAFSPDGKTLATAGYGNTVRLWELATGKEVINFKVSDDPTTAGTTLAFSPDGKILAAGYNRGIRLCEAATGKEVHTLRPDPANGPPASQIFTNMAFSRDGKLLAAGFEDGSIGLWDAETGKALPRLSGHTAFLSALAFAPDGKTLASGGHDRAIHLWDLKTRKKRQARGHESGLTSVAFSPDGKTLLTGSLDKTARLWDLATKKETLVLTGHKGAVTAVAFAADSKRLATASLDETVRLWDRASGREINLGVRHKGGAFAVAFSPRGARELASGGADGTILLTDTVGDSPTVELKGHKGRVTFVGFTPDGKYLISGSNDRRDLAPNPRDNTLRLWELYPGREKLVLAQTVLGIDRVALSADGKTVTCNATTRDKALFILWETLTGKERDRIGPFEGLVTAVALSPDGKVLAAARTLPSGTSEYEIGLWDTATGKDLGRLKGHVGPIKALAFSPDGKKLASASDDTTALIWDVSKP